MAGQDKAMWIKAVPQANCTVYGHRQRRNSSSLLNCFHCRRERLSAICSGLPKTARAQISAAWEPPHLRV